LAPYIAGLVGIGAGALWERRAQLSWRIAAAATVALTGAWSFHLLSMASTWQPWVRWTIVAATVIAAVLVLVPRRSQSLTVVGVIAVLVTALLGPTVCSVQTVTVGHTGALPSAGPSVSSGGGQGGPGGQGGQGGPGGQGGQGGPGGRGGFGGGNTGTGNGTSSGHNSSSGSAPGTSNMPGGGQARTGESAAAGGAPGGVGGMGGGASILGGSTAVSKALQTALSEDADEFTWVAATVGSSNAATYQLATGEPVMAIGGYNGTDPAPTLAQFQQDVADGEIHWFIPGTASSSSTAAAKITEWVESHYTATTIGGTTLYDLSSSS
jgi:hypothetical protein